MKSRQVDGQTFDFMQMDCFVLVIAIYVPSGDVRQEVHSWT